MAKHRKSIVKCSQIPKRPAVLLAARQQIDEWEGKAAPLDNQDGSSVLRLVRSRNPSIKRSANFGDLDKLSQQRWILKQAIQTLSRPERLIIICYYFEEMQMDEVARTLDISEDRAKHIREVAISRVKVAIATIAASTVASTKIWR